MRAEAVLTAILLVSTMGVATATTTTDTTTADVTLRVAPEGFVVPNHPAADNEAVWLIDPVEDPRFNDQEGVAGCRLTVPDADEDDAIDGSEVLDHATDSDCILGWDAVAFGGQGRFVTVVDGLEKAGPTETGWPVGWWAIQVDGRWADVGIDAMSLEDGQSLSFIYYSGLGFDPTET